MVSALAVASLLLMLIILAAILGAVDSPERYLFVAGIALFIVAHELLAIPEGAAVWLAVIGIVIAAASTVPLLRQSV